MNKRRAERGPGRNGGARLLGPAQQERLSRSIRSMAHLTDADADLDIAGPMLERASQRQSFSKEKSSGVAADRSGGAGLAPNGKEKAVAGGGADQEASEAMDRIRPIGQRKRSSPGKADSAGAGAGGGGGGSGRFSSTKPEPKVSVKSTVTQQEMDDIKKRVCLARCLVSCAVCSFDHHTVARPMTTLLLILHVCPQLDAMNMPTAQAQPDSERRPGGRASLGNVIRSPKLRRSSLGSQTVSGMRKLVVEVRP